MLEAMKRKRQQEILKSQMKISENNQRNCGASNNFDFRRFSLHHQQQQQQQQLNGIFNQKQLPSNLPQSNINSLMLAKSNSEMMHQQQQQHLQRQQQQQYPYRGINFPINQQAAQIGAQHQQHRQQQHHNPFMGRPILKSSIGSMNTTSNNCPTETTK